MTLTDLSGGAEGVDNVVFGMTDEAAIPEPSTFGLAGIAFAALGFMRRRSWPHYGSRKASYS